METAKMVRITVMGREGHREVEVDFDGAVDLCRTEIGKGKWLRVITGDGKSYITTTIEAFTKDLEKIGNDILNAQSVMLMSQVRGGGCTAPGKFGYNKFGFDVNGYDKDGYDVEGYDVDGLDRNGLDVDGDRPGDIEDEDEDDDFRFDAEGYDADGFNAQGLNRKGEPRDNRKTKVVVKIVKDESSASLVVITADAVIFNNAYGKEAVAEALSRLSVATEKALPQLMGGTAVVVDPEVKG